MAKLRQTIVAGERIESGPRKWTDKEIRQVCAKRGLQSASQVAERFGVSRNSIIGLWNRYGNIDTARRKTVRVVAVPPKPLPKKRRVVRDVVQKAPTVPIEPRLAPEPTAIDPSLPAVATITATSCHFPLGDPRQPDFRFCAAERAPEKSYCPDHCRIAYIDPKSRPRHVGKVLGRAR